MAERHPGGNTFRRLLPSFIFLNECRTGAQAAKMQAVKHKDKRDCKHQASRQTERNKGGTADIIRPLIAEDGFFIAKPSQRRKRAKAQQCKKTPSKNTKEKRVHVKQRNGKDIQP